jgi:Rrf2 family protein
MRIKATTNYGIRIVLFLAASEGVVTSKKMAGAMDIPVHYELKIARQLMHAGIIKRFLGVKGGFQLAKAPEDLTLFDVIKVMEPNMCENVFESDGLKSGLFSKEIKKVHFIYDDIQVEINKKLRQITIASLLAGEKRGSDVANAVLTAQQF